MFWTVDKSGNSIEIPRELAGNVFYFLPNMALKTCQCVSKVWNEFISLNFVWEGAFLREYPQLNFKITYWKEAFEIVPKVRRFFASILTLEYGSYSHLKKDTNPLHQGMACLILPQPIAYLEDYRFYITGSSHVQVELEGTPLPLLKGESNTCLSRLYAHKERLFALRNDSVVTQWNYLEPPYEKVDYKNVCDISDKSLQGPISVHGMWQLEGFLILALCTGDDKYYLKSFLLNVPTKSFLTPLTGYPKEVLIYQNTLYVLTTDTVDVCTLDGKVQLSHRITPPAVKDEIPECLRRRSHTLPKKPDPLDNQCFAVHGQFLCVAGNEKIFIFNLETWALLKTIPFKIVHKIIMHHDVLACWNGTSVVLIKNWEREDVTFIELPGLLDKEVKRFPMQAWETLMNNLSRKESV